LFEPDEVGEFVGFRKLAGFGALRNQNSLDFFGSFFYQEKNEQKI
jgi:hypothetical protein